ncbi:hypothetical protein NLS1_18500 [Nocardioides sp. LS1]|nr:hypothetical protein NLS1_18500 [Nocardioides sp. LS1]
MSKARLVITAVTVEKRPVAEVAATYGMARSWIYELLTRYQDEGEAAFEPRSRRPKTSPNATPAETIELILRLRKELLDEGHDAGADTLVWHLLQHHRVTVSRATVHRILTRHGAVTPEPKKKPKSSYIRFEAAMPNQTWQSDFTHYPLTDTHAFPTGVEIITWLDDCSTATPCTCPRIGRSRPRSSRPASEKPQVSTASPRQRSPTTEWSTPSASPASAAKEAETASSSNYVTGTWSRRTLAPATPPPAARSNASSRP